MNVFFRCALHFNTPEKIYPKGMAWFPVDNECSYDFPHRDDRGKRPIHWEGGEHIHLGPKHIKVND